MLKKFLKLINNLPFKFTIAHVETFGSQTRVLKEGKLDSPESWDLLRRDHPHFSISSNRKEWLEICNLKTKKDGQDGGLIRRAKDIVALLKESYVTSLFSVGAGGAGLEYHVKNMFPQLYLVCSEYAADNVDLLKKVFLEADEVVSFDMKAIDWKQALRQREVGEHLVLMYRIDPHATDKEWRKIFERMHGEDVKNILFIPCGFLTLHSLIKRKWRILKLSLQGESFVFSGYLRTRMTYESYWDGLYRAKLHKFGGLDGYYLQHKDIPVR
ncbi:hypothetical protein IT408_02485 [Candidatus Uhrbacteria bacterium]|nr:hypothetical protein [Candidatus Uhrbacteria bacterium]